jgi:tRNA 2-selenouridine synthase
MPIEQIDIEKFLTLANELPVIDVRSPNEFQHAHIPGAYSLPLFSDEQRKIIGTSYKHESRQAAVTIGLEYFSEAMKSIYDDVGRILKIRNESNDSIKHPVLVHCWRGGMRSGAIAWLLSLYGLKVYTLQGGYKSFRKWVLEKFEEQYNLNILGGFTGSGKTMLLQEMKQNGYNVINLEALANHKGSAFGSLGEKEQPGQEMFENLFALELHKVSKEGYNSKAYMKNCSDEIWIEDESPHIGTAGIPKTFWSQMRTAPLYFLDIPFEERLKFIVNNYGQFNKEELINSIARIQKRLGGLETKNAINFLRENNFKEGFAILLRYYDKLYQKSLHNRESLELILSKIPCPTVDIDNIQKLLA